MSQQHELELHTITTSFEGSSPELDSDHNPETLHAISSLPRADGGKAAWMMLLACFVFEALLWGFPLSFGVFQNYYSQLPEFKDDPFIAVVGTTASGISYMAAPIVIPFIKRYSAYRRQMIWVGWPLCLMGLVAGSFAKTLPTLIITQGVMYGVGFTIFYYPIISMVNEYWIVRRGMAYGILCSASGVSGAVMPICINVLLRRYGYPTTLRAIAIGLFICTGPLIFFLKGRAPEEGSASRTDWSFLRAPRFWVYSASNFAMGLGYFFPSIYLPSYASANGLSPTHGATLLAIMSISQVLGQMSFGYLSDGKLPLNLLATSSTLVAAAAVYGCWGVAHSFGVLVIFALFYGFFGAGYTALWGRMGTAVTSEPTGAFAAFGFLNFGKGVGNMLAGPVGGALLKEMVHVGSYGTAKYESLVLFTGSCMIISSATVALCYVKKLWK
jgi:predicted MFS family arabinose efflux permease